LQYCSNCGKALAEGALFCPGCGAIASAVSVPQPGATSSHFNSGVTATAQPLTTDPEADGFAAPPPPRPEERKRTVTARGFLLVVIAVLVVLLAGATLEAANFGHVGGGPPAINSPSTPFSGGELYSAYAANQTQAAAAYNNKTLYIRDSLDLPGVNQAFDGQYFSSVDAGTVIMIWNGQTQVAQLSPGSVVLARCSVEGLHGPQGAEELYLQGCDLISVQTATSSFNVSSNNL
jgi:zinc-ribbon domain